MLQSVGVLADHILKGQFEPDETQHVEIDDVVKLLLLFPSELDETFQLLSLCFVNMLIHPSEASTASSIRRLGSKSTLLQRLVSRTDRIPASIKPVKAAGGALQEISNMLHTLLTQRTDLLAALYKLSIQAVTGWFDRTRSLVTNKLQEFRKQSQKVQTTCASWADNESEKLNSNSNLHDKQRKLNKIWSEILARVPDSANLDQTILHGGTTPLYFKICYLQSQNQADQCASFHKGAQHMTELSEIDDRVTRLYNELQRLQASKSEAYRTGTISIGGLKEIDEGIRTQANQLNQAVAIRNRRRRDIMQEMGTIHPPRRQPVSIPPSINSLLKSLSKAARSTDIMLKEKSLVGQHIQNIAHSEASTFIADFYRDQLQWILKHIDTDFKRVQLHLQKLQSHTLAQIAHINRDIVYVTSQFNTLQGVALTTIRSIQSRLYEFEQTRLIHKLSPFIRALLQMVISTLSTASST